MADHLSILSLLQSCLRNTSGIFPVDLWKIHQDKVFPLIRLRSLPDSSLLLSDNFTRVIFVRHPLERLASAYIDKIASLQASPFSLYDNIRRTICRKFASFYLKSNETAFYHWRRIIPKMIDEPCGKVVPSFQHFLEHIISDSVSMDVHWQPYSSLCQVCALKYNFIGKYETMQTDLNTLMSRINLTSNDLQFDRRFSTGRTKKQYQLMYSNLSDRLMCRLKYIYHNDFKLFDYRLEDYLSRNQTLSCSFFVPGKSFR
ncbi:unnamed protein product [Rotaria sp. Silwood1]|nr:unnamed protein product [Rotaria sp. Silwood1]